MPYNIAGAWPTFESYYQPPDPQVGPCRRCYPHNLEDHEYDMDAGSYACQIKDCDCDDGREMTLDDYLADEADRVYNEWKESW